LNTGQINELKELMEDAFEDLISTYLTDSDQKNQLLQDAINGENLPKIAEISHSLKGSSANICAQPLSLIFKDIEDLARSETITDVASLFAKSQDEYNQVKTALKALI
jgi:HPt (histidine-containing phosphotransfer) domain-containing protein